MYLEYSKQYRKSDILKQLRTDSKKTKSKLLASDRVAATERMIVCHVLMRNMCPHQPGTITVGEDSDDEGTIRRQRKSRSVGIVPTQDLKADIVSKRGRPKKAKSKPRRKVGRPKKHDDEVIEAASMSPLSYEKELPQELEENNHKASRRTKAKKTLSAIISRSESASETPEKINTSSQKKEQVNPEAIIDKEECWKQITTRAKKPVNTKSTRNIELELVEESKE